MVGRHDGYFMADEETERLPLVDFATGKVRRAPAWSAIACPDCAWYDQKLPACPTCSGKRAVRVNVNELKELRPWES